QLAHRVGGYAVAVISMIDGAARLLRPTASAGVRIGNAPAPTIGLAESNTEDLSITRQVTSSGEAVFCNDIQSAGFPINGREDLTAAGVRGVACLPLTVDDTPVGTFFFGSAETAPFAAEEAKLLREVAANLSFALQYLQRNDAARFLTYFDPLTGLAKRTLFCERLGRLLTRGRE